MLNSKKKSWKKKTFKWKWNRFQCAPNAQIIIIIWVKMCNRFSMLSIDVTLSEWCVHCTCIANTEIAYICLWVKFYLISCRRSWDTSSLYSKTLEEKKQHCVLKLCRCCAKHDSASSWRNEKEKEWQWDGNKNKSIKSVTVDYWSDICTVCECVCIKCCWSEKQCALRLFYIYGSTYILRTNSIFT